jgi:hypothetical protein
MRSIALAPIASLILAATAPGQGSKVEGRGFSIDASILKGRPDHEAVLEAVRRQVDIVLEVRPSPRP